MSIVRRAVGKAGRVLDFLSNEIKYAMLNAGLVGFLKGRKKLIGFYGECHIYIYGAALSRCSALTKDYVLLGAKEIEYLAKWHSKRINQASAWNHLDVLIYNPGVPDREGAPSLNQVLTWLPEGCRRISVTNAAFKGYMPQHTDRVFRNEGCFIWGDKNLNALLKEGKTDGSVDNIYTQQYVNEFFDKSVRLMKMYERDCTIRIADYIESHGRERVLYYSVTHPETEIMEELTRRILKELGVDQNVRSKDMSNAQFDLHSHGELVYPCVYTGLGIKEDPYARRIQPGNYKDKVYTFKEYLSEYLRLGKESTD